MKRYIIINECPVEISQKAIKKYGSIFDAHCAVNGLKNGTYTVVTTCEDLETAFEALKQAKTKARLISGFSNVKFYDCDIYYIVEEERDKDTDEWEETGSYDSAAEEFL